MVKTELNDAVDLVAVYGTLKSGLENHYLLANAEFLGTLRLEQIVLYDLGEYPAARLGNSSGIEVEIYAVENETLKSLDLLEEYDPQNEDGSLYRRKIIATDFGEAWIYLYNGRLAGRRPIRQGSWQPRRIAPSRPVISSTAGTSK